MTKGNYNLCIIKPNKSAFSETFVQAHIDRLAGHKFVLYGGAFPVYDDEGKFLVKSPLALLSYLIKKRIFKKLHIAERTDALKSYLIEKKIDVVLAEYGMVGAMVSDACQLANVPLIIHFHGADVHHHGTVDRYFEFYKQSFIYASKLVAVSQHMVEALKQLGAPADKIMLNPYGVDAKKFSRVDVADSPPNFLTVGRFVEKKSPQSVVKAFKILADRFPKAKLWMVGEGPLFEETTQLLGSLELQHKVTLTGKQTQEQIRELMTEARVFVQHSVTAKDGDAEGTPNAILEASASGLPIISTKHAGINEAVINGTTGYLVDEHDVNGMADAMMKFAGDAGLAKKMGDAGREYIIANYNITQRISALDNIIQSSLRNIE